MNMSAIDNNASLRAENLLKRYSGREVVSDVSFFVNPGEVVGLLGPNGAGKTTSFYAVVGLVSPEEGRVFLGDDELTHLPMYIRARKGVGYLPQEASVFRALSVEDNIKAILELQELSKEDQNSKLEELLEEFRLIKVRKSMGAVLSGGERRRTEIARALACDPNFILLDEPFAALDVLTIKMLQEIIVNLQEESSITICICDHQARDLLACVDTAMILSNGKIVAKDTPSNLVKDINAKNAYFGDNFKIN